MRYIIKSKQFGGHIEVAYNHHGLLKHFINDTDIADVQLLQAKMWHVPLEEVGIAILLKKGADIVAIPDDYSFENFWNIYAYKVGNKDKSAKLWKLLSPADQKAAIAGIAPYNLQLATTSTAKLYPERYISYRRWENYI